MLTLIIISIPFLIDALSCLGEYLCLQAHKCSKRLKS